MRAKRTPSSTRENTPRAAAPDDDEEPPTTGKREALFAALAILSILIGINRITDPTPPPLWMQITDVLIAAAFLIDWATRIHAAATPARYALRHAYEILFFIPFTLIPAVQGGNLVRGARLLRLLRLLRHGRYIRLGLAFTRLPRRVRQLQAIAHHANLVAIGIAGVIIVTLGGGALMLTEAPATGLGGFGHALWWSLSLFTTVAYAIPEPQTDAGRLVSATLIVAGVAYVGVFTASLASAILRTLAGRDDAATNGHGPG